MIQRRICEVMKFDLVLLQNKESVQEFEQMTKIDCFCTYIKCVFDNKKLFVPFYSMISMQTESMNLSLFFFTSYDTFQWNMCDANANANVHVCVRYRCTRNLLMCLQYSTLYIFIHPNVYSEFNLVVFYIWIRHYFVVTSNENNFHYTRKWSID